jgi:hypothetical protein
VNIAQFVQHQINFALFAIDNGMDIRVVGRSERLAIVRNTDPNRPTEDQAVQTILEIEAIEKRFSN